MSLKEVCRACLHTGRTMCSIVEAIVPKFDSPSNSVQELFRIFIKMLIPLKDRFPNKICNECIDEIQRLYSFILQCENSEDTLKKLANVKVYLKKLKKASILSEHDKGNIPANLDSHIGKKSQHSSDITSDLEFDIREESNDVDQTESEDEYRAEIFTCPACRFGCATTEDLEKHLIEKHVDGSMCKLCNKEFRSTSLEHCSVHIHSNSVNTLRRHLKMRKEQRQINISPQDTPIDLHNDDNFQMEQLDRLVYNNHAPNNKVPIIQVIKQEPELDIDIENDEFDEIESEAESRFEIFKCSACLYKTSNMENLREHLIEHHMDGKMCKLCNKEFKKTALEHCFTHLGMNSMEDIFKFSNLQLYKCEICRKPFAQKSYLRRHLKIHSGLKPFQCAICPKAFRLKCILTEHLRRHAGERPFKCEICSKTFVQKGHLKDHLRCHTDERPFKCEICIKAFRQKNALTTHLRSHTGARPFKCSICLKDFADNRNLVKHSKRHRRRR